MLSIETDVSGSCAPVFESGVQNPNSFHLSGFVPPTLQASHSSFCLSSLVCRLCHPARSIFVCEISKIWSFELAAHTLPNNRMILSFVVCVFVLLLATAWAQDVSPAELGFTGLPLNFSAGS
jgi:hypothetical protein